MSFLNELHRRRVLSVAGAYIAIAWLVTEIASFLLEQAAAPGWVLRLMAIVFVVGFPLAVVLAWVIQRQPDGNWSIDSSRGQRRAVTWAVVLGILATVGLSWLILPRLDDATGPAYQPIIPNLVAILPISTAVGTEHERSIANTLFTALEIGLDQSTELTLMDLRNLKDQPADLAEFGRGIKVAALLTGRLLQASGGTRIRMELVDAATGNMVWSQSLDWDPTRIADTATTIANGVLQAMDLSPLSDDGFTGTKSPEAYDAFLAGLRRAASYNIADLAEAMGDFQRAIDLDPEYVLAHVELAETIVWYLRYRHPEAEEFQALKKRATQALETAQALAPESADVVSALGLFQPKRELKIQAFKRALVLDPNHAKSYHRLHWRAGAAEAERLLRKALELEPFNGDWHNDLATVLYDQGRDEEAFAEVYESIELEPELVFNHYKMGSWAWLDQGRLDEALIHWRKAYAFEPDYGSLTGDIAGAYAFLGAWEEALAWLDRLAEKNPADPMTWFTFYQLYYPRGETDKALEYLQQAVDLEPGSSFSLHALGLLDIRAGQAELALERWRKAFPVLTTSERPEVDIYNLREAMYYATNLLEAGDSAKAEQLLQGCLDALRKWQNKAFVRESLALDMEMEIHAAGKRKDKTLALMRRIVIDQKNFSGGWMYEFPAFDFLRDDPEFQEIMEYFHAGVDEQLERVREMDRNGKLPPAPGIVFE